MTESCALLLALGVLFGFACYAEPGPGDVFKEWTYKRRFDECDPGAEAEFCQTRLKMIPRLLDLDLEGAVRAEIGVEFWGGHIGTSDQKFRANEYDWILLPQPQNTPSSPYVYYRTVLGSPAVPIPLEQLRHGSNSFQFTCGPQIKYSFGWGFYWIYAFTVRVYYDETREHVTGRISTPVPGATFEDSLMVAVVLDDPEEEIEKVDFIARYEDFDWEGNGVYRQWHYQQIAGGWRRHLGTVEEAPYAVTWNTAWVPDQDEPVELMARITDARGVSYMTPVVEGLALDRADRSVKMYKAYEVPENFGVRAGIRKTCKLFVAHDLDRARSAQLVLSTWSAAHVEELGINDVLLVDWLGRVHDHSFDRIEVPLEVLREGMNEFYIYSGTAHHAAEVNWPGPVLVVEYEGRVADPAPPAEDLVVFEGGLAPDWDMRTTSGAVDAAMDPVGDSTEERMVLEITPCASGRSRVEFVPAGIVIREGYRSVRFAFYGQDADDFTDLVFYVNGRNLSVQKLGIEWEPGVWQTVEVPLDRFPDSPGIESLGLFGIFKGAVYLGDLRLVLDEPAPGTAVTEETDALPKGFSLEQNIPNPFNGETAIRFSLPIAARVELDIFDIAGQKVASLVRKEMSAGTHGVRWDGRDGERRGLASGVYLYRLRTGDVQETRKLLLLR